jgi:hypothetical protein
MVPRNSSARAPNRLSFGSPVLGIAMTVPVKKADADRVRLFSLTERRYALMPI